MCEKLTGSLNGIERKEGVKREMIMRSHHDLLCPNDDEMLMRNENVDSSGQQE